MKIITSKGSILGGIQHSMSRKGNCWVNDKTGAAMESANGTLKVECVNRQKYASTEQARHDVLEFIGYYNHDRAHSSLGMQTPAEFEQAWLANQAKEVDQNVNEEAAQI
jgi:putative transposase